MDLVTWDGTYSVHVRTFDLQHQQLFGCVNELHEAMLKGMASSALQGMLIQLVKYTKDHFAAEEAVMVREGYSSYKQHRAAHQLLTASVEDFVERHRKGELALSVSLMDFLRDWLEQHIRGMDQDYSIFMKEHGVT